MGAKFCLLFIAVSAIAAGCQQGEIELVGQSTTEDTPLFGDYVIHVNCTFRNTGKAQDLSVFAELDGAGGRWKKFASGAIGNNETREFRVSFPEAEFNLLGDNRYTYRCGLE